VDVDADSLRELLDGRIPSYQIEKRYRHAWGHYLWGLLTVSLVRDDQGKILYVVSQVQDISERREMAQRLEYLIDHDFLTGLATGAASSRSYPGRSSGWRATAPPAPCS